MKKDVKKKATDITVKANKNGRHISKFLCFMRVLVIPIFYLLKPFRFYGNRKVKDGACIYICNHYKLFDPVYCAATTWESIHFLVKREAAEHWFFKPFVKQAKSIPVNRDGNDARALLNCFKCLKNNEKIAIWPEGTRNKTDAELLPFRHGAAAMAIKSKTPIVPIMIYEKPRYFRCTHILIGEPFELTEYYDKKLTESDFAEADEKLRALLLKMRADHKQFLENKKKAKKA